MTRVGPLLLLAACSEYDIARPAPEVTLTATTPLGLCGAMEAPSVPVEPQLDCSVPLQEGTFTPEIEWQVQGHNGYGPPVVGQLDDDNNDGLIDTNDTPDIAYVSNNGEGVVFVNGKTGAVMGIVPANYDGVEGLAIGDLEGDGAPELIVAEDANTIVAITPRGEFLWRTDIDTAGLFDFLYPAIADMDGDGIAEVTAGRSILDADGRILGQGTLGVGAVPNQGGSYVEGAVSIPVDLDGDGLLELVTGNAAYNIDGSIKYSNGLPDGCPAVADFDGDGEPEVFAVSGNTVFAMESDLTPTGFSATFANTNYIGPPAADDLDGDGLPEVVVVGSGEMRAYDFWGDMKWAVPVQDTSGAAGPILFDFEQDGYPEIVYADEEFVRVYNGLDGSVKLVSDQHSSATGFETPIVADVDADGEVEILVLHGSGNKGLSSFGDADHTWPPGRQTWNQHAYSITNVNDDLTIPSAVTPNWDVYNNFRSGNANLPPDNWRELNLEVLEICIDGCPAELAILVRVSNEGTEAADGVTVVVEAGVEGVVAEVEIPGPIEAGMSSEGVTIRFDPRNLGDIEPVVRLGSGALGSCDPDDDVVAIEGC